MDLAPRPRFVDHLRVAGLLIRTVLGVVPILLWILLSPVLTPWVRARLRRRLREDPGPPAEPPAPEAASWNGRTVFVVAGEASGDQLAARVVTALGARCPGLRVRGYAGPQTAAAGAQLDRNLVEHAVVGVTAVIASLGTWWGVCTETLARLREEPPDVFLTVDFPGLNGRLARWARGAGVRTVHLVAPAVWAYLPYRIVRWRRALDRLLTTFPFEAVLYRGSGVPSVYVGHPLFEAPLAPPRTPGSWPGDGPCRIELLPGSRRQEIAAHAAPLLEAAAALETTFPQATFVVRLAHEADVARFDHAGVSARRCPKRLETVVGGAQGGGTPLLGALACSGTVTAELGAALVPMAVFYRLSWPMRVAAWLGLTAPYFGLANLVAGEAVVPERLQAGARGDGLAEDFLRVAGTAETWARTRQALDARVRNRLAVDDVADRAARAVLEG